MGKEYLIQELLNLKPGDILIYEMPFEDAKTTDMFPFKVKGPFEPGHSALWVNNEKPVAHSVREGYKLPGLRLTNIPEAKCMVFRLTGNDELNARTATMMENWALSSRILTKDLYLHAYPLAYWKERHTKDLRNFFKNETIKIESPATPYAEPRATSDLGDLARNAQISQFTEESLRRAVKFASRRNLTTPDPISKGQRCTAILVATFQAAVLAPIVKPVTFKKPFKGYKKKPFLEYANEVLIEGWQETDLGKKLIAAIKSGDYSTIFPKPFMIDQRYASPKVLFNAIKNDATFQLIGRFSYFQNELEIVNRDEQMKHFDSKQIATSAHKI